MAADVSSLVRVLKRYKDDRTAGNESSSTAPITRDLLGGGTGCEVVKNHSNNNYERQELDLDMQVPSGWEKRLDLKSGKVYLQRCNTPSSPSSSDHRQYLNETNQTVPKLQDLNLQPSPSSKPLKNIFDESSLELKLVTSSSQSSSRNYQSVCTLDKVKSALERAKKEPNNYKKRLSSMWHHCNNSSLPLSPSYSSSSSSIKDAKDDQEIEEENLLLASPIAVGCPGCLCYVLVMKNNPKCPRCNSVVPLPAMKKPRIDLNISM